VKKGKFLGWRGFGPNKGKFVEVGDAFPYVCEQVGITVFDPTAPDAAEFKEMLVDWYFSGNWVTIYEGEDDL
jgi:hypothetical protein